MGEVSQYSKDIQHGRLSCEARRAGFPVTGVCTWWSSKERTVGWTRYPREVNWIHAVAVASSKCSVVGSRRGLSS
jgi:hypothetical protein